MVIDNYYLYVFYFKIDIYIYLELVYNIYIKIMTTPLTIIQNELPYKLCDEIINHIQQYLRNELMYNALGEYFDYLCYKNELYENFILYNYIIPYCNCSSFTPDNGNIQVYKKKECSVCFMYNSTTYFMPKDYELCIINNPQYSKIRYGQVS